MTDHQPQPLRILHVTTSWPRSGDDPDGSFVASLVAAQRAVGHDVHIAMPPRNGVLGDLKSPLRWGRLARALLTLWRRSRPVIEAWPADVIHCHWWPTAAVALAHRMPRRAPRVIVTMHGSDVELLSSPLLRALGRRTLRNAASVHAVSASLASRARELLRHGAPEIRVTRSGDDDVTVPDLDPISGRSGVLFAGHLERHKGALELPVLAAALRARQITDRLDIYGAGSRRETIDHRLRERRGANATVHGAVARAELLEAIGHAAVVVCPSFVEGFGLVCREALDRGVPVVAYATGGLAEQLAPGVDGFVAGRLVEAGDVNALADAVAAVLADHALRCAVHERAVANAGSVRNWADVAADYAAAYVPVVPETA